MDRRLEVSRTTRVPYRQVREVLLQHLGTVLSGAQGPSSRTFTVELAAGRDDGRSTVRELVELAVEAIHLDVELAVVDLSWHAVKHARLFPRFGGTLAVSPVSVGAMLRLSGAYEPPFGTFGAFADGVIGHRLARQSIGNYLDEVVARVELLAPGVGARPARAR